jgi:rSAM/selenodomain-associated transferase 1
MRPVVILFAKAPVSGGVKTRLATRIGARQAADLHAAFVSDELELLATLGDAADVELHTDIETDAWAEKKVSRKLQSGGDLGARMYNALETALRSGRPQAMIVGGDVPTLPAAHLRVLLASTAEVALGPTEDGGFYAIGCRRVHPGMFRGVRWSGPQVLEETVRAAKESGLSVELGPQWFDVDSPEDLDRLASSGSLPRHTAALLRRQRSGSLPQGN